MDTTDNAPHWTYRQKTGEFLGPDGNVIAHGYSGHGDGLNNPAMESAVGVGPIPAGNWSIDLEPLPESHHLGPLAFALTPVGFNPHGRSAFRIHGDNAQMNNTASDGCIILQRSIRQRVFDRKITRLVVTA